MSTRSLPFAGPTVLCSGSGLKEGAGYALVDHFSRIILAQKGSHSFRSGSLFEDQVDHFSLVKHIYLWSLSRMD